MRAILEIDNSHPKEARVLANHEYSIYSDADNISIISKILQLDRNGEE